MIKLKDLLASSSQKGHISQHHPAQAFAPAPSINENKIECPQCKGKGCDHCDGKGYHLKENADEQLKAGEKIFNSQGPKIFKDLENMCDNISKEMGSFMYPGFKAALHDAIMKSIRSKRMIDSRFIIKEMKRYFGR